MLVALAIVWQLLALACGIASLVFFIMVLVQMFKREQTTLGIVCIVLTFCVGVGPIIAFVYGWMKATEWNLKKTMTYWTVALVLYVISIGLIVASVMAAAATMVPDDMDFDPNNMNFEFKIDEGEFQMPDGFEMPEGLEVPGGLEVPDDTTFEAPQPAESSTDQP